MSDLTPAAVDRILGFVGYGNPAAPLWFIGLEEGLGGMNDADVAANLVARGRFSETMDLVQSHMTLVEGGRPYNLSLRYKFTPVWLWMARFARAIEGAPDWEDLDLAKEYVRARLGRSDGGTFLTYASPIPEKRLHTRQWTELLNRSGAGMQGLIAQRAARVRAMIEQHRPSIVICHGTTATRDYQSFLPPMDWHPMPGNAAFLDARDARGLRRFITPFFGVGQMSFDRAEVFVHAIQQVGSKLLLSDNLDKGLRVAGLRPAKLASSAAVISHRMGQPRGTEPMSNSFDEFNDNTDPACTIKLLDRLVRIGLANGAFALLHHKREKGEGETISGFRTYCINLQGKFRTASNPLVHERLVHVLTGHLAGKNGSAPVADFETLADRAYKAIPPR